MRVSLKLIFMVIGGAACFAVGAMFGQQRATEKLEYVHVFQEFEQLSVAEDARRNGVGTDAIAQVVVPLAVYMGDEICVGMAGRPGVLGGETTYCFDRETKQPTRRLTYGE